MGLCEFKGSLINIEHFRLVMTVFKTTDKKNHFMAGEMAQRHRGHIVFTKDLSQVPSTLSDNPSSDALRRKLKRKRLG